MIIRKKVGLYPGSFNPWTIGHTDILNKAFFMFDQVVIVVMQNPDKPLNPKIETVQDFMDDSIPIGHAKRCIVNFVSPGRLLVDVVATYEPDAIIRGIRDGKDMEYELSQQRWNEDLGVTVPTVYFAADRNLAHVSSSAIRAAEKIMDVNNLQMNVIKPYWKSFERLNDHNSNHRMD